MLARAGKIPCARPQIVTGIASGPVAPGCGGANQPWCLTTVFPRVPGDAEPSYCCSAKQFDVL